MPNYLDCVFHVDSFRARKEESEYVVLFCNADDYYVLNDTGMLILNFIKDNACPTIKSLEQYLKTEFENFSKDNLNTVLHFLDKTVKLSIVKTN